MALKKYFVTKDIYHKGKLIKSGSIVASETNHKYFEPYSKEEFSNEKEPATIVLKDEEGKAALQYDENGIVIKPGEKKPVAPKPTKPENSVPKAQQPAAKGKTKAAAAAAEEDEDSSDEEGKDNTNESEDAF
jgi:hypothetical protein